MMFFNAFLKGLFSFRLRITFNGSAASKSLTELCNVDYITLIFFFDEMLKSCDGRFWPKNPYQNVKSFPLNPFLSHESFGTITLYCGLDIWRLLLSDNCTEAFMWPIGFHRSSWHFWCGFWGQSWPSRDLTFHRKKRSVWFVFFEKMAYFKRLSIALHLHG